MMSRQESEPRSRRPVIAQIIPSLDAGGAERTTLDVAAALARAGFTPLVVSEGGRMVPELTAAGAEWVNLPVNTKSPLRLLRNAVRLGNLIRTADIALVHARSRAPAWSTLLAARMTGTPFVTTYHGIYSARFPLKRFYNSVMLRADAVIANSRWTAAHIEAEHVLKPKKLVVIPRGTDTSRFDPARVPPGRVNMLRRRWHVAEKDMVVLLPGRLTRWKGQLVLIAALAQLSRIRSLASVRVLLAGDAQGRTSYVEELARAIAHAGLGDRVEISGHVDDMPAAYLAADIVVSASTDPEAFGRVAAEAGAMERPVIATDHGGARETVLPGVTGLLVPPGNANVLARALEALLSADPVARAAMGKAGRAHIARHFTLERMTGETIALYRALLEPARS